MTDEATKAAEAMGEAVADIISHSSVWRGLLESARDRSAPPTEDFDDGAYYQHELEVLDRIRAYFISAPSTPPIPDRLADKIDPLRDLLMRAATAMKNAITYLDDAPVEVTDDLSIVIYEIATILGDKP